MSGDVMDVGAPVLDVTSLRGDFPALASGLAFFDGPGGSQTPSSVGRAIAEAVSGPLSNRGRRTLGEIRADDIVVVARAAMGDLLAVAPGEIVFGRSATQLTYDLSRMLAKTWGPGDEIVVSRLDHDANVRPWIQAAEAAGATVRWIDFDPATAELSASDVQAVLSERTRLVALTGASNLIGSCPPLGEISAAVHGVGALLHVDGVHLAAHRLIDRDAVGADSLVCSPYKFLGPHLGVLTARGELLESLIPDKLLPATNVVPERFEFGTLPYELLAGVTAAVDYLAGMAGTTGSRRSRLVDSFSALDAHEERVRATLEAGLAEVPGVTVYSRAAERTPTLLLTIAGRDPADASAFLAERDIAAPAGSFYAIEPSRRLGLGDAGGLRVGLAPYTDDEDIQRLLAALTEFTG